MIAYKFLAPGALAPFTGFRWPAPGEWVTAPADPADEWIHACRPADLAHWLEAELWRFELGGTIRARRYQVTAPRGRLVARVTGWDPPTAWEYARVCALRARDLALPHVEPAARDALAAAQDLEAVAAAADAAARGSRAAAYVADAARNAREVGPSTTSYIAAALASSVGAGLAAFEAERAWQARWLVDRLAL